MRQVVQAGFITVPIPASNSVTTQIGVGTPFAPFSINATTPAALQIYVFGSTATTPSFMPVTDIDPTTVTVNGVAFPNATLVADPNTANHLNGIVDAIITITPRANLNLASGTVIDHDQRQDPRELRLAQLHLERLGDGNGHRRVKRPVVSAVAGAPTGPVLQTVFVPTFGANQYTPSLTALSALNYAPIPLSVALAQYVPSAGFRARIYSFNHPASQDQGQQRPESRACQRHQHAE